MTAPEVHTDDELVRALDECRDRESLGPLVYAALQREGDALTQAVIRAAQRLLPVECVNVDAHPLMRRN